MGPGDVVPGRKPGVSWVDLGAAVAGVGEVGTPLAVATGGATTAFSAELDGATGTAKVAGGAGDKPGTGMTG